MGNLEEGSSTGDFERWMKGALDGASLSLSLSLSLKRLRGGCLGGPGGSSFTGDPGRYVKIVSRYGHLLSPLGPLSSRGESGMWGGDSYAEDFDK